MSLRFAMSGGNFIFSKGPTVGGIWASSTASIINTAGGGFYTPYAHSGNGAISATPNLGGNFATLIQGYRIFFTAAGAATLLATSDTGTTQTDLRMDASGLLFFTRNGTNLGAGNPTKSTFALLPNTTNYIEIKVLHAITAIGTAEVRVNGVSVLSLSSVQTANTNATANAAKFINPTGGQSADFVVVDGDGGITTNYLGDIFVQEVFPNGDGANTAWTPNVGPFTLTSVNTAGVYQGTITGGATNAYVGYRFNVTGFVNGANNQTAAVCTASTATAITLGGVTITETHAGSAAFQAIVQAGVSRTGTRPNDDVAYILDSTAGHIYEFTHDPLTLTGTIAGVVHQSYARKDDAGIRQIQQVCKSGGTVETSSTISLGSSYQYYQDILEQDPNTSATWTVSNFNSAQFGVKEIT